MIKRDRAIPLIKRRYRKFLRSRGVPEFVIRELNTIPLLRSFARGVAHVPMVVR